MNHTYISRSNYTKKKWYIIDANQKSLGRLATLISIILQGKHKIDYEPSNDLGDYLIVINAKNIIIDSWTTGHMKFHAFCPGRPGSSLKKIFERVPQKVLESALKNMLPDGKRSIIQRRLKIYDDSNHPHQAQKPILLEY